MAKLIVADDHPLFRNALINAISSTFATKATMILHCSYSILLNPCNIFSHLTNLIPTFCIPTKEQIVFGVTERLQY